eukprot:1283902-Lingulodinium_polyedra.AAC.1
MARAPATLRRLEACRPISDSNGERSSLGAAVLADQVASLAGAPVGMPTLREGARTATLVLRLGGTQARAPSRAAVTTMRTSTPRVVLD